MSKAVVKQDLKTEALKLALECVEAWDRGCDRNTYWRDIEAAVTAIREALAHAPEVREQPAQTATYTCGVCGVSMQMEQPAQQQEPVAWLHPANASDCPVHNEPAWPNGPCDCGAQPEQEPKLPEFYARFEDGVVSVYQRREDETPLLLLRENLPGKQPAQQQEPVAYRCWNNPKNADGTFDSLRIWVSLKPEGYGNEPLYTSPQPSKPEKK